MVTEHADAQERLSLGMQARHTLEESAVIDDTFTVECYDADGRLIWRSETARAVVDVENHRLTINPPNV
jgi:hypothetical protein